MKKLNQLTIVLALLLFVTACTKPAEERPGNGGTGNGGTGSGVLKGVVYSPNGKVPLAAVTVETTVNGAKKSATSDMEGRFSLALPAGDYDVKMFAGAGAHLSLQKRVKVEPGKTTEIPASHTALSFNGKIAYLAGEFDAIQTLVTEMGIPATPLTTEEMQDYKNIKQYDVLLLNCMSEFLDFGDDRVLERFLKEGHSIYASDWEMSKLSAKDWGFIPENLLSYNDEGVAGETEGNVLFEPFKTALGKSKITIEFDMPKYVQITGYARTDERFKVLVDHPQKGPLAMRIQWGPSRLSAQGIPFGGDIIYTTFHDATLSNDVKAVLRQMILQL